jgi:acyl dehydratase
MAFSDVDLHEVVELTIKDAAEVPNLVGKHFVTPYFQMDPERAVAFEHGTYLDSYVHPYLGDDAYGADLVEGFHLLGMIDYLCNSACWSNVPGWLVWNYGLDKARFVTVVRHSDMLRIRGTVTEVIDRGKQGYLVVTELVGEVRGREKPGFTAIQRGLWTTAD